MVKLPPRTVGSRGMTICNPYCGDMYCFKPLRTLCLCFVCVAKTVAEPCRISNHNCGVSCHEVHGSPVLQGLILLLGHNTIPLTGRYRTCSAMLWPGATEAEASHASGELSYTQMTFRHGDRLIVAETKMSATNGRVLFSSLMICILSNMA
jgi:hypothetical protein